MYFQVFEDALDDVVEATEINISALNNNIKPRKSLKLKSRKSAKHAKTDDISEDVSLDQGLAEAQEAIDMFFKNQFEESREIAQKQWDFFMKRGILDDCVFSAVIEVFTMPLALAPSTIFELSWHLTR